VGSVKVHVMNNILDLPVELLVFIISLLPSSRDLVKLRYVSKSFLALTEVPLLWRKFVWPLYRRIEETSIIEALKVNGSYIRRLSFSTLDSMHSALSGCSFDLNPILRNCSNVTNLTLITELSYYDYQFHSSEESVLNIVLQNLKCLEKLEISWSYFDGYPSSLKASKVNELTLHMDISMLEGLFCCWIDDYISTGYRPQCVNFVQHNNWLHVAPVIWWWSNHSTRAQYRPPDKYTAHFKFYTSGYRVAFNHSPPPQIHIQFHLTPSVKVTKVSDCNIFGQDCYMLKMNHCSCTYSCKCVVTSATIDENAIWYCNGDYRCRIYQNCQVDQFGVLEAAHTLNDVRVCVDDIKRFLDKDLEQLSSLFPNLQSLDLTHCDLSTDNMRGIRAVAINCLNLKGLNLMAVHASSLNPDVLWQVLSGMKLTYLSIECCLIPSSSDCIKQTMGSLCVTLQAIELGASSCKVCEDSSSEDILFCLSHFSSLNYCHLFHPDACHTRVVQDIATTCKKLKCLKIGSYNQTQLHPFGTSLSIACNDNLEQFGIDSKHTVVSDEFMESISAHGGLINVNFNVSTITEKGVGILIENSPKLMKLTISTTGEFNQSTFDNILMEIHNYQKLIARGIVKVIRSFTPTNGLRLKITYDLFNSELLQQDNLSFVLW